MEKKNEKTWLKTIILGIFIAIFALSLFFSGKIDAKLNKLAKSIGVNISKNELIVHYISVGQGDAIAINFPNEEVMIIDCGTKISTNVLVKYIANNVLKDRNNRDVDYLVISHPDIDHSGGGCAVFEEFDVKNFYRPNIASIDETGFAMVSETPEYAELINKSKTEGCNINIVDKNYEFNVGNAQVKIFAPLRAYSSTNEMSCVVRIKYLEKTFLFVGDLQDTAELDMLEAYGNELKADVLKVGHHGSYKATSLDFINCVKPEYAVISVGINSYGHPNMQVINNLKSVNATVLRTDELGDIRFCVSNSGLSLLDEGEVCSTIFLKWWKIVVVAEIGLSILLVIEVVRVRKLRKRDEI